MWASTVNVNILINKILLIVNLLDVQRLDFPVICATWLTSEVASSFVDISRKNLFGKDVAGATGKHGVGLYIRKDILGQRSFVLRTYEGFQKQKAMFNQS